MMYFSVRCECVEDDDVIKYIYFFYKLFNSALKVSTEHILV